MADKQLITNKQREEAELLIYSVMDKIDPTKTNSDYYREIFMKMDNNQFYKFFTRHLPLRYHFDVFKNEPKMYQIIDAFKVLNKPLFEKLNLPYIYTNSDGIPVSSKECLVMYIHIKRMKQMVIHKSHVAINTEKRDMKTGLLTGEDKGAKETDREFEALASYGLDFTMEEFARPRGDSLKAAAEMNAVISAKGSVSEKDYDIAKSDSLGKNMLNVYLMGANIHTNLVDTNYMTPYTASNRQAKVIRQ